MRGLKAVPFGVGEDAEDAGVNSALCVLAVLCKHTVLPNLRKVCGHHLLP